VQCRIAELAVDVVGKVVELAERQRLLAYPQCCVNEFLCVRWCPHRAEPHHVAALA